MIYSHFHYLDTTHNKRLVTGALRKSHPYVIVPFEVILELYVLGRNKQLCKIHESHNTAQRERTPPPPYTKKFPVVW